MGVPSPSPKDSAPVPVGFEEVIAASLGELRSRLAAEHRRALAQREGELLAVIRGLRGDLCELHRQQSEETVPDEQRLTLSASGRSAWGLGRGRAPAPGPPRTAEARLGDLAQGPRRSEVAADTQMALAASLAPLTQEQSSSARLSTTSDLEPQSRVATAIHSFFSDPGKRTGGEFQPVQSTHLVAMWQPDSSQLEPSSRYVLAPNGRFRVFLEIVSILALSYDALMIPFLIAWNLPSTEFLKAASVATLSFWMCEMLLSFFTGFLHKGEVVLKLQAVAIHYLKTWFLTDLVINSLDLFTVVMEFSADKDGGNSVYFMINRNLRILKVSRLVRVFVILRRARESANVGRVSRKLNFLGLGTKLVVTLLWLNHLLCCFWYWIADNGVSDTGYSWLDLELKSGKKSYKETGLLFQYFTSLHWAMTQMTPGSMSVVPQNSWERLFNVACLIVGLFVGALLVSQLSAQMVKAQLETQEQTSRMKKLHAFLRENGIDWPLRARVEDQIQARLEVHRRLTEQDVPLLELLSTSLRRELSYSSFAHHLLSHTRFHTWGVLEPRLLEALCLQAVELVCLSKDDDLFTPHSVADKLYLVMKGSLKYYTDEPLTAQMQSSAMSLSAYETGSSDDSVVEAGAWLSEVALWMEWSYKGGLTTLTECELLSVSVPVLLELLPKYSRLTSLNHHYAHAFCRHFGEEESTIGQDLACGCEHVLISMPLEWRLLVMRPLVERLSASHRSLIGWAFSVHAEKNAEKLVSELEEGKCILSLRKGHVQRTVLLATLNLRRSGGEMLVRLARLRQGVSLPALALPGTKLRSGESATQAVRRLLDTELAHFRSSTRLGHRLEYSEMTNSATYGIPTKYMKTMFCATLLSETSGRLVNKTETLQSTRPGPLHLRRQLFGLSRTVKFWLSPADDVGIHHALNTSEVLLLGSAEQEKTLYAWLPVTVYEFLKTSEGAELLRSWLHSFNIPDAESP